MDGKRAVSMAVGAVGAAAGTERSRRGTVRIGLANGNTWFLANVAAGLRTGAESTEGGFGCWAFSLPDETETSTGGCVVVIEPLFVVLAAAAAAAKSSTPD